MQLENSTMKFNETAEFRATLQPTLTPKDFLKLPSSKICLYNKTAGNLDQSIVLF